MAFTFPSNPNVGDTYTVGSKVWVWSGTTWDAAGIAAATSTANLSGGSAGQIPYQTAANTTSFIANGATGQVLTSNGTSAPTWSAGTADAMPQVFMMMGA
jgi:hypothetical protein